MPDFKRIALIGPGLLGGSMGMALRALPEPPVVCSWARREETVELLLESGCVDSASTDLEVAVAGADLIVLATPVGVMTELAHRVVACAGFNKSAVITDVGSVKLSVVEQLEPIFDGTGCGRFVGSHPMAGSEKAGVAAACAELFKGAVCLLTPTTTTDERALQAVEDLWQRLEMRTVHLGAAEHDRTVARISHLPHMTAAALVMAAEDDDFGCAGPGFRDSTRIAAGPPAMWAEILIENRGALKAELEGMRSRLGEMLAFLDNVNEEGLRRFLAEAKIRSDLFRGRTDR